jgi:predicted ATPase
VGGICIFHTQYVRTGLRGRDSSDRGKSNNAARGPECSSGWNCFERAIEISREQCAKSLELRATTSLARLLASQGNRDEARARLTEVYNWFTEGFDTADLKEAKVLLDDLNHPKIIN